MSVAPPCTSADEMTPGVFNANAPDVAHAWMPARCSLQNVQSSSNLCAVLDRVGIRRILLLGDSHARYLFGTLVHALLPPKEADDTALMPERSHDYCDRKSETIGSNRFGTAELLNMLCFAW